MGLIPRLLLSKTAIERYEDRLKHIPSQTSEFFRVTEKLSVYNVPPECGMFTAPYVRKGVRIPRLLRSCLEVEGEDGMYEYTAVLDNTLPLRHHFRFLSPSIAKHIAQVVSEPA